MSGFANNQSWLLPPHLRSLDNGNGFHPFEVHSSAGSRPRTPAMMIDSSHGSETGLHGDGDFGVEEDPKLKIFKESFARSDARLAALFGGPSQEDPDTGHGEMNEIGAQNSGQEVEDSTAASGAKKTTRTIDEDDYDDDDEDEDDSGITDASPLKGKGSAPTTALDSLTPSTSKPSFLAKHTTDSKKALATQELPKTVEEIRKKLEEDKKAAEDAAKRSFHTIFYTLENDMDAMLEQQKLDELDRQVDAEMSNGQGPNMAGSTNAGNEQHGKLSNANLGASSLTLKHLIARIDAKRDQVRASDAELRSLMSEVRKNRSKWAHEDKVGQEELYEAAEKVLNELKAHTEHSTAFLSRVNKREAPDYYHSESIRKRLSITANLFMQLSSNLWIWEA
jgi:transcriptional activator SPT7